jgi:hypothetical protein
MLSKFSIAGRPVAEYHYEENELMLDILIRPEHRPKPINLRKQGGSDWEKTLIKKEESLEDLDSFDFL